MSKVYSNAPHSETLIESQNESLKKFLTTNFSFEAGYVPEGYDAAFLLIKEDLSDSFNDLWKIVFYKEIIGFNDNLKNITLDNINEIDSSSGKLYEQYNVIEGSFEKVIEVATELINRHNGNVST